MHFLIGFFTVDNGLGRFDTHSLTDEFRMELMLEGLSEKSKRNFKYPDGSYKPVCDWSIVECDADGRVVEICSNNIHLEGSVSFTFLPLLVTRLSLRRSAIFGVKLRGTINTADLPENLEEFDVSLNVFKGTVDMTTLPSSLVHFKATVNLLSGTLSLNKLPPSIESIELECNNFCGEIQLVNTPATLRRVLLGGNSFSGIAVVSFQKSLFVEIGGGGCEVTSVVDGDGNVHPDEKTIKGFNFFK